MKITLISLVQCLRVSTQHKKMIFKHSKTVCPQVIDTYCIHTLSLHRFSWEKNIAVDWKILKTHLKSLIHRDEGEWLSLVAQWLRICPPMQEIWVRSLGQEDPLEKEMATHTSILAWRIPRTEEPGRLQSTGSQSVRHD